MKTFQFSTSSQVTIDINDLFGKVTINSGKHSQVTIKATGEEESLEQLKVTQEKDEISIRGSENSGTVISNGNIISFGGGAFIQSGQNVRIGTVTMNGQSITMTNGGIWINGKKVNGDDLTDFKEIKPLDVVITIPSNIALNLELNEIAELFCNHPVINLNVDTSGQCKWKFCQVESFVGDIAGQTEIEIEKILDGTNLDISGQSRVQIPSFLGSLKLDVSGQSGVTVSGSFKKIDVDISGQSSVVTTGSVSGNLIADVSGMSSYIHSGKVQGRVKKDSSGMSSVLIQ